MSFQNIPKRLWVCWSSPLYYYNQKKIPWSRAKSALLIVKTLPNSISIWCDNTGGGKKTNGIALYIHSTLWIKSYTDILNWNSSNSLPRIRMFFKLQGLLNSVSVKQAFSTLCVMSGKTHTHTHTSPTETKKNPLNKRQKNSPCSHIGQCHGNIHSTVGEDRT